MFLYKYILNLSVRSSRSQVFFKVGVPKNIVNFTGKYVSLFFIKLQGFCKFIKKRPWWSFTLRHNEILSATVDMLSMMCKNVRKEPPLSATPDSNDELRADINVRSFWQILQRTFVNVMVFYPFAQSYPNWSLAITMKTIENQKKRKYNKGILDGENGSFTTLLFTTNGGMSNKTKKIYKRLIQLLHGKSDVSYSDTSAWVKR